jgi:hypothetical protein
MTSDWLLKKWGRNDARDLPKDSKESKDAIWENERKGLEECEKAYSKYLADRQMLYSGITPESQDPERRYANNESARAYDHYKETRKKIFEQMSKKNWEIRRSRK